MAAVQRNNGRVFSHFLGTTNDMVHVRKPLRTRREPRSPRRYAPWLNRIRLVFAIRLGRGSRQFLAEEGVERRQGVRSRASVSARHAACLEDTRAEPRRIKYRA